MLHVIWHHREKKWHFCIGVNGASYIHSEHSITSWVTSIFLLRREIAHTADSTDATTIFYFDISYNIFYICHWIHVR